MDMKKIILILTTAFVANMVAVNVTNAQIKYDAEGLAKKLEANDKSINHPKKSQKAAVWVDRGNLYYQLATGPIEGLFAGMTEADIALICGKPTATGKHTVTNPSDPKDSKDYSTMQFPNYTLFLQEGKVAFWTQTISTDPKALDKSLECYLKANTLDPKLEPKMKEAVLKIANALLGYSQNTYLPQFDYISAAQILGHAYDIAKLPIANRIDTAAAYNAGYIGVVMSEKFPEGNDLAIKYLNEAEKYGFDQNGDLYYYLYFAYKNKKDLENAEKTLDRGIAKYPTNKQLTDCRIELYMSTNKDLNIIIKEIDKALVNDPNNFGLHFNKAILYDRLKDYDKSLENFEKAALIKPDDFGTQYNMGIIYVRKSDNLIPTLNSIPYSKQKEYDAMLKNVKDMKRQSIKYFKRALEISPDNYDVADVLKNLYFYFREESAEMQNKYNEMNEVMKTMTPTAN